MELEDPTCTLVLQNDCVGAFTTEEKGLFATLLDRGETFLLQMRRSCEIGSQLSQVVANAQEQKFPESLCLTPAVELAKPQVGFKVPKDRHRFLNSARPASLSIFCRIRCNARGGVMHAKLSGLRHGGRKGGRP